MASIKKNYIFNLTYNILQIIIPIITVPYLSRILEPDGIGIYSFSLSIANYFILLGNLGIKLYGQREIAKVRDDISQRSKIFYELFLLKALFVIFSLLIYFVISFNTLIFYRTYLIILSLQVFSVIFDISFYFQALEKFKIITFRGLFFKILNVILIFIFIRSKSDLIKYFIIHVICNFLSNLSLFTLLKKSVCKINIKSIKPFSHFKKTFMLFLPQVAIEVYTVLDKTMIGLITKNNFENGYYEQSEKIIKLLLTIITSLAAVIIPRASYYLGKNNKKKFIKLIERSYSFSIMLALPMMFGILIVSKTFVPLFFGAGYDNVIPLMNIFSVLFIAIGINNVTGMQYLIPANKENIFTLSVCIGALSNLILNLFLIPKYSATGAAIASITAEIIITVFQLFIIRKELKIVTIIKQNIKCIFSALVMYVLLFFIDSKLFCKDIFKLIILTLSSVIIYFSILILTKYKLIYDIVLKKYIKTINTAYFYSKKKENKVKRIISKIKILFTYRFFKSSNISSMINKVDNKESYQNVSDYENNNFAYYLDTKCLPIIKYDSWNNFTPDYKKILDYGFMQYKGQTKSFKEALQRILFLNQLFWQAGHKLVGLGRLDYLLNDYYQNDINNKIITEKDALEAIKSFLLCLHKYYEYKSSVLIGDTGQIIILGGCDKNYQTINLKLTLIIMQAFYELKLPDPKFIFRYTEDTSEEIFSYAVKTLTNNCGSPVFASDKKIIEAMQSYGYKKEDTWNYGLSACWEPLIPGKSRDVNNYYTINLLEPVTKTYYTDISYDEFCKKYFEKISEISNHIKDRIENCSFEKSEIFELFVENTYNYFGITVSGFINCVKCFLNIKHNTINNIDFDYTDAEFINEADMIFKNISNIVYPVKIGTSSPSYMNYSVRTTATPDGRKDFDFFELHISDNNAKDYSSTFIFASKLDYKENRFNGNVTDVVLSHDELIKNFDNIKEIIRTALEEGVFQIQVSILDYKTLVKAKANPELYPNLIVRVWGFSAYFKDLPEEYQNFVIERARQHENN